MADYETIHEEERDGWHIAVQLHPDYDYDPSDADCYPPFATRRFDYADEEQGRDYDGRFLPRPIVADGRSEQYYADSDEIRQWGELVGLSPRRARREAQRFLDGLAGESLYWVGVVVVASRGEISGDASLWGIDYDARESARSGAYVAEVARELMPEAIEQAARAAVGELATLALSYE